VKEVELGAIRAAYAKLATPDVASTVKLTAIVAAKRHNTRFYPINPDDMQGKDRNCKPGTLVDDTITSPFFRDFYLQSHSGLQGTARPTHCFILEDEIEWGFVNSNNS
jgi:eukaryotic translation initiation factor 2C